MSTKVNVHYCPDGRITQRAGVLALLVRTKFEGRDVVEVAEQIADDVTHMREAGLCLRCGYPLDNSSPHPAAHHALHGHAGDAQRCTPCVEETGRARRARRGAGADEYVSTFRPGPPIADTEPPTRAELHLEPPQ